MNDESFWSHLWREIAASTALMLAFWGALGGATNALTTRMALREALRHVLLGGLIAAGMGSFSIVIVTGWLGLPDGAVAAGGAGGAAAPPGGVFWGALLQPILARLRPAREGDADA